jgi:hypothetical protein
MKKFELAAWSRQNATLMAGLVVFFHRFGTGVRSSLLDFDQPSLARGGPALRHLRAHAKAGLGTPGSDLGCARTVDAVENR